MSLSWLAKTNHGPMVADYISTSIVPGTDKAVAAFIVAGQPNGTNLNEAVFAARLDVGFAPLKDITPPTCVVTDVRYASPAGLVQQDVSVEDTGSGLADIYDLHGTNTTFALKNFTFGTTDFVVVTATKIDSTKRARWQFRAKDMAGYEKHCV